MPILTLNIEVDTLEQFDRVCFVRTDKNEDGAVEFNYSIIRVGKTEMSGSVKGELTKDFKPQLNTKQ